LKSLTRLVIAFCACSALALAAFAGPEALLRDSKDKEVMVAPAPSGCDWSGFYVGLNAGGQFGHSEDKDLDDFNSPDKSWGYSESGAVAGGQIGYNLQWRWLVVGPEIDLGYMNVDGNGVEPSSVGDNTRGFSNSDFYTTFRGRIGVALNCWLFYATGGGIGVNYDTRVFDNDISIGLGELNAHKQDFDWGYTVGGGIERKFGRHWSIKVEYLYFNLDDQTFSAPFISVAGRQFGPFGWRAETEGHIVRAGLNFHF
jgi:outer membrane immunogenic protein